MIEFSRWPRDPLRQRGYNVIELNQDDRRAKSMLHTVKVIGVGFVLLSMCLVIGRLMGGAGQPTFLAQSALVFIALWLVGAGINMWMGVSKGGYSVKEEIPFFLIVFLVPAAVAFIFWWRWKT